MEIRSATPDDVDAVLRLMRDLAIHEELLQYFALTAESLIEYCFTSPARLEILVATEDGEVIGYATYMAQLSPWAAREYLFLDDLYVVPARRGSGAGSLLMQRVGEIATTRGMDVRWHVEAANVPAQKFYRSLGAELRSKFIAYWLPGTTRDN